MLAMVIKYPDLSSWEISTCIATRPQMQKPPKLILSLASLGLSWVTPGPTHTASHILDLIFSLNVKIIDITIRSLSLIDDYLSKAVVRDRPAPREQERQMILIQFQRLMDSDKFQSLPKDSSTPSTGQGVKDLVNHYHSSLTLATDALVPKWSLPLHCPHRSPGFSDTLHCMKRGVET